MPELPEVEVVARGLQDRLLGRTVQWCWTSGKQLRSFEGESARLFPLVGQVFRSVRRRSKTLVLELDTHRMELHLGMSGVLWVDSQDLQPTSHDAAWHLHWALGLPGERLCYKDPRRFGDLSVQSLTEPSKVDSRADLGLEPLLEGLSADALGQHLWATSRHVQQAIKPWLMAGRAVVGVGNIYASECLFRAGIDPRRAAGRISALRHRRLAEEVQLVLAQAILAGGSTLRDYRDADNQAGRYGQSHAVYGRQGQPCPACGAPIRRLVQAQRSTFFCGACQT